MIEYSIKHKSKPLYYGLFTIVMISFLTMGIALGSILSNSSTYTAIDGMNSQISELYLKSDEGNTTSVQYYIDGTSLSDLYSQVKDSIVVITGVVSYQSFFRTAYTTVQGSGFVCEYDDSFYVITNNHVVSGASDIVVTFSDGDAYAAEIIGSDPYADLSVLTVDAPENEFIPLTISSPSDLRVGDPVVAIGTPLGLDTTMTTGIISQLGRTIEESLAGSFPIANIIQTNVAINPGNSGGPLLNYQGEVIGITAAIIEDSEGIGFAIPSDTIIKELDEIINDGSYTGHSWLGISGVDMTYEIAQALEVDVTYGWLVTYVVDNSAASLAGLQGGYQQRLIVDTYVIVGGDIIISIDGHRIINGDSLMSYLESETSPSQVITLTIVRDNTLLNVPVELASRPVVS